MDEALKLISRRTMMRSMLVAGALVGGIVAVRALEAAMHATFDKPPAPLRKPLQLMRKELGSPVRYVATKPDEILDKEVVETLGTSEYLVRQYTDSTVKTGEPGSVVNLNVNYYATGSSTPHVPEICWAGGGWQEVDNSRNVFDVKGMKRKDGSTVDLRVRMISFTPGSGSQATSPTGEPLYSNVAYVFQVNGNYVATPQEVTSQFWRAAYKYAYHCKIEITPMENDPTDPSGQRMRVLTCTQNDAQRIVSDFLRSALPEVEECLPDPAILTSSRDSPGAGTGIGTKN